MKRDKSFAHGVHRVSQGTQSKDLAHHAVGVTKLAKKILFGVMKRDKSLPRGVRRVLIIDHRVSRGM